MREIRSTHRNLVGNPEGRKTFERLTVPPASDVP
jgi:hypothetical protein